LTLRKWLALIYRPLIVAAAKRMLRRTSPTTRQQRRDTAMQDAHRLARACVHQRPADEIVADLEPMPRWATVVDVIE
jgi:hypothetical protein